MCFPFFGFFHFSSRDRFSSSEKNKNIKTTLLLIKGKESTESGRRRRAGRDERRNVAPDSALCAPKTGRSRFAATPSGSGTEAAAAARAFGLDPLLPRPRPPRCCRRSRGRGPWRELRCLLFFSLWREREKRREMKLCGWSTF
jgi:hypothetical protein